MVTKRVKPTDDELPDGACTPVAPNWCHSVCNVVTANLEWNIRPLELRGLNRIDSSPFSSADVNVIWNLYLDNNNLFLRQHFPEKNSICKRGIRVKTCFVNARREKLLPVEIVLFKGASLPLLVNSLRDDLFVNDAVTVCCEIETVNCERILKGKLTDGHEDDKPVMNHKDDLCANLENLFQSMELSDVIFIVHGQQIQAHKFMLWARSPVFAEMFQDQPNENLTFIVDDLDPDIKPDVFNQLLRYIYTGEVPLNRLEMIAVELMAASEKYGVKKLKKACGDHLVTKISPENCVKLLSLDELHPAYYLRGKAVDFLLQFPAIVMATNGWKRANEEKPTWFVSIKRMLLESLVQHSKACKYVNL